MRPIPRNFLIHSVYLCEKTIEDAWGKSETKKTKEIRNVKVEYSGKLTLNKQNEQKKIEAVMYYDCFFSTPAKFEVGDYISFKNNIYRILNIQEFGAAKIHHLEIELGM